MEKRFTFSFFQQFLWIKNINILMKVKIFDEESEKDLEEKVNNFLEETEKEILDIKYQVSCSVFGEEQIFCFSAMIVYN